MNVNCKSSLYTTWLEVVAPKSSKPTCRRSTQTWGCIERMKFNRSTTCSPDFNRVLLEAMGVRPPSLCDILQQIGYNHSHAPWWSNSSLRLFRNHGQTIGSQSELLYLTCFFRPRASAFGQWSPWYGVSQVGIYNTQYIMAFGHYSIGEISPYFIP